MIRCIAVDDEPLALRQLAAYLGKVPYFEVVCCCQSASEASAAIASQQVDVMFLDISMPDLNGLDFVRTLSAPPMVVFTTAYQEYAIDGYKVDAIDYILKPFGVSDIMRAAEKVKRLYSLLHAFEQTSEVSAVSDDNAIYVRIDHKVVRVPLSDIVYVEGMSEYVRIHLHGQPHPLVVLFSMKKMEERLSGAHFMRVHKSYIISLRHIVMAGKNRVALDTGDELPIGNSYRERFCAYMRSRCE